MSPANAVQDYLVRQLALDPVRDAADIVAQRDRMLAARRGGGHDLVDAPEPRSDGDEPAAVGMVGTTAKARERAARQLDSVRRDFWNTQAKELNARLDEFDSDQPDLQEWARRLRAATAARRALVRFQKDGDVPRSITSHVSAMVLAPPQEAARSMLRQLDQASGQRAQRIARRVRRQHPAVHALEPDFFARLARLRQDRQLARPTTLLGGLGMFFLVWWLIKSIVWLVSNVL